MRKPSAGIGSAYLLAIAVLLVLTGLGIVLSEIAGLERRLGSVDQDHIQALNAADSGLALATGRLLAGEEIEELEVVFGMSRSTGPVRFSRVKASAPELIAVAPGEFCNSETCEWGRVSYAISATGERLVQTSHASAGAARTVARVAVEAVVTLQPWPVLDLELSTGSGPGGAPCDLDVRERLYETLARELHPPGCGFGARPLEIRALDSDSGSICAVELPVCVLMTHWSER